MRTLCRRPRSAAMRPRSVRSVAGASFIALLACALHLAAPAWGRACEGPEQGGVAVENRSGSETPHAAEHIGTLRGGDRADPGMVTPGDACEPRWTPDLFRGPLGTVGLVDALTVFDDGSGGGPTLYAGGGLITAGGVAVTRIARWDGAAWSPLGTGISGGTNPAVYALTGFDDGLGGGPALHAAGQFTTAGGVTANRIARWDGAAWSPLGTGLSGGSSPRVFALTVFDDGSGGGPALYAGGVFTTAGGVAANRIARWDGANWSPLGTGMSGGVSALAVFDDGSGAGPALYAAGGFTTAGGVEVNNIARWDGSAWSPLGSGVNGSVSALTVFDDGSGGGPALYAGGWFTTAGGVAANYIARWDGSAWSPLGTGVNGSVSSLTVFDDGSGAGPALYAGGGFSTAGGAAIGIARWDGSSWSPLGAGTNGSVSALTVFDDGYGGGPALYAGGWFTTAGGLTVNHITRWDGDSWSPLAGPGSASVSDGVRALAVFDDGSGGGPALYAAGELTTAGGVAVNRIARWSGASWSALGTGVDNFINALTVFDDGSGGGPALYAGGEFITAGGVTVNHIARWDGSSWSPLGNGIPSWVYALTVFDDGSGGGPALYAGGAFGIAGDVAANRIARWDGSNWSPLGSGMNSRVFAMTVFDDGSGGGPALYAGGQFTTAGGVTANRIARWDGSAWSALGSGMGGPVWALAVFDDGSGCGPALYAGGDFGNASGVLATRIARWDGSAWSALGSGMNNRVSALAVFDDGMGDGPALYAGGLFTIAGGVTTRRIARWNGSAWSALGSGMTGCVVHDCPLSVSALSVFDDGSGGGPALYAGGIFTTAGGTSSAYIARWEGCASAPPPLPCPGDANNDGKVNCADITSVLSNWLADYTPNTGPGDADHDGVVNFIDITSVLNNWLAVCP